MTIRAAADRVSHIGAESSPGSSPANYRFIPTLSVKMMPKYGNKDFRAQGSKVTTSKVKHKKFGEGSFEGVLDFNSIIYVLSGICPHPTASQIASLTAYSRQYRPNVKSPANDSTRKTYSVEQGDSAAADRYAFCQMKGFQMESGEEDLNISGSIVSQFPTLNSSLTTSGLVNVADRPVEREQINVYLDTSWANIGMTQITDALSERLSIGDKYKEVWTHNRSKSSWADVVETTYEGLFSFDTVHNAQSRSYIADIANNEFVFIRWEAIGDLLGSNGGNDYYETLIFDMAGKIHEPEDLGDQDGPFGLRYNVGLMSNPDMGRAWQADVINAISGAAF